MNRKRVLILLLALSAAISPSPAFAQNPEPWNFIGSDSMLHDPHNMLSRYLDGLAENSLAQRQTTIAAISSSADLTRRGDYVRQRMWADLGGQPERTPLNARVVGTLNRDGYRIEKIVFESRPNFYVTANLYVPTQGKPPYPAILYPLGHEEGAKSHYAWQYTLVGLVRRGFICLTWDPVGQGERVQFYDPDWHGSKLQGSTTEHSVLGLQSLLIGTHIAQYTIWDGLRALDYLLSRPEVDPKRVGCTGNSGGGTHTAYISALDSRIQVAAPSCYITSWHRMLQSLGPQDAEQVFPWWLQDGLDFPDFIYAFSGKPFLILSAIRDFFPIEGARATYAEVKSVYGKLDLSDKISMFAADDGHGYNKPRREMAYRWFTRWLENAENTAPEAPLELESEHDLECTKTGQVKTAFPDAADVYSINRSIAETLKASRHPSSEEVRSRAISLAHYEPRAGKVPVADYGTFIRSVTTVEKVIYESEPGIEIPALLFHSTANTGRSPAIVIADGRGKAAVAAEAEALSKSGHVVMAIDLRGMGETSAAADRGNALPAHLLGGYRPAMTALLVGKTIAGMRALDVVRAVDLLSARRDVDPAHITVVGEGAAALPVLYAALFDNRISGVALDGLLGSYHSMLLGRLATNMAEQVVPSALKYFDIPDVIAALTPRKVLLYNTVSPLGEVLTPSEARQELGSAVSAYTTTRALSISVQVPENRPFAAALAAWLHDGQIRSTP